MKFDSHGNDVMFYNIFLDVTIEGINNDQVSFYIIKKQYPKYFKIFICFYQSLCIISFTWMHQTIGQGINLKTQFLSQEINFCYCMEDNWHVYMTMSFVITVALFNITHIKILRWFQPKTSNMKSSKCYSGKIESIH